ncbi:hypothetical protein Bca52824_053130 [Brassica carinata]|uniref:UEV domain-containing protein n=1 Tax=Brassica carinata TaxID=52824 RepID=A0A8X7UJC8_BRACI|nr:hypothetical protein Bca52824_053130 [Brassica carinata]
MASSSSDLSKMQKDMEDLLALHGKSLYDKIQTFPAQAKKRFIDQVTRRIVPQPNDVALYIEQGGEPMRNEYLKIVHELLLHNPYNGFYPPIKAPSRFNVEVPMFIHKMRRWGLAHTHLDDVLAHIKETLYCYPWMKSEPVTNLLNFAGDVYYIYKGKYFKAFITIYLPESYPNDPPQAWVVCEDGTTAIDPVQMHVAPNGSVSIPYLWDWDGKSSTLLQFILHMSVEFTSQPPTFAIDRELLKIILDYRITHLYDEIIKITPARTYAFFDEVAKRYPPVLADLAGHIRTSQRGVNEFIDIVAELLGQPSKTINNHISLGKIKRSSVSPVKEEQDQLSRTVASVSHSSNLFLHQAWDGTLRLVEGQGAPAVGSSCSHHEHERHSQGNHKT